MKDAYYFPHDSNAKDDPNCILLIETLGLEGYGIYWILIETLREQEDYKYPLKMLPSLARRFNTTFEKMKSAILDFDLFIVEDDVFFYSESLIKRMLKLEDKKEVAKKAANIRWEKYRDRNLCKSSANAMQTHSISNATVVPEQCNSYAIREEEIREDEIRIEDIKKEDIKKETINKRNAEILEEFEEFWKIYDLKIGKSKCIAEWEKMKVTEKELVFEKVNIYLESLKDLKYKKHPLTWLKGKHWEDEIEAEKKEVYKPREKSYLEQLIDDEEICF